jgi:hypothetical protein
MGPCAGEEEQKTTTDVVVDVHIAHLAGCSPAGIGTRRMIAGCRASKGRFPPPLWMSAGLHSLVDETIAGGERGCQEGLFWGVRVIVLHVNSEIPSGKRISPSGRRTCFRMESEPCKTMTRTRESMWP